MNFATRRRATDRAASTVRWQVRNNFMVANVPYNRSVMPAHKLSIRIDAMNFQPPAVNNKLVRNRCHLKSSRLVGAKPSQSRHVSSNACHQESLAIASPSNNAVAAIVNR